MDESSLPRVFWTSTGGKSGRREGHEAGIVDRVVVGLLVAWVLCGLAVNYTEVLPTLTGGTVAPLTPVPKSGQPGLLGPAWEVSLVQVCGTTMLVSSLFDLLRLVFSDSPAEQRSCLFLLLINTCALSTYVSLHFGLSRSFWEVVASGKVVNVTRMLCWVPSTAIMVALVSLLSSASLASTLRMMAIDVALVLSGLAASLCPVSSFLFWVLALLSMGLFARFVMGLSAWRAKVLSGVTSCGEGAVRDITIVANVLGITGGVWVAFPAVWVLQNLGLISDLSAERWFAVLDVVAKCILSMMLALSDLRSIRRQKDQEALRASAAHKKHLLRGLSHDLHTPLHGILASIDRLRGSQLDREQKQVSSILEQSGKLLANTLKELFIHSGVMQDKVPSDEVRKFPVADTLEGMVGYVSASVLARGVDFLAKFDDSSQVDALGHCYLIEHLCASIVNYIVEEPGTVALLCEVAIRDLPAADVPEAALDEAHNPDLPWISLIVSFSVSSSGLRQTDLMAAIDSASDPASKLGRCRIICDAAHGTLGIDSLYGKGSTVFAALPMQRPASMSAQNQHQVGQQESAVSPLLQPDLAAMGQYDVVVLHPDPMTAQALVSCVEISTASTAYINSVEKVEDVITSQFVGNEDTTFKLVLVDESMVEALAGIKELTKDSPVPVTLALMRNPIMPAQVRSAFGRSPASWSRSSVHSSMSSFVSHPRSGGGSGNGLRHIDSALLADVDIHIDKPVTSRGLRAILQSIVHDHALDALPLHSSISDLELSEECLALIRDDSVPDSSASRSTSARDGHTAGPQLQWHLLESISPGDHVLVVDDTRLNMVIAMSTLKQAGFLNVDSATNGVEAVTFFQESLDYNYRVPFILMDINMPILDGLGATTQIRELERAASDTLRTPIIALSADLSDENRAACEAAGMDAFLTKPFNREDLVAIVLFFLHDDITDLEFDIVPRVQPFLLNPPVQASRQRKRAASEPPASGSELPASVSQRQ